MSALFGDHPGGADGTEDESVIHMILEKDLMHA